jgi:hypothetical protein
MRRIFLIPLKRDFSCLFLLLLIIPAWGFDLTRHSAPVPALSTQVIPRDAIPAIDNPELVPASEVDDLAPEERVIGVDIGAEARAYPISILHGHEIVNDNVGGRPIAVTW